MICGWLILYIMVWVGQVSWYVWEFNFEVRIMICLMFVCVVFMKNLLKNLVWMVWCLVIWIMDVFGCFGLLMFEVVNFLFVSWVRMFIFIVWISGLVN